MDKHDLTGSPEEAGFPSAHALIIAIAAYARVSPLPAAVINDRREIAAILISSEYCGYNSRNVTLLLDGQATLEAIRLELDSLAGRADADDTVTIYFSGHGERASGIRTTGRAR